MDQPQQPEPTQPAQQPESSEPAQQPEPSQPAQQPEPEPTQPSQRPESPQPPQQSEPSQQPDQSSQPQQTQPETSTSSIQPEPSVAPQQLQPFPQPEQPTQPSAQSEQPKSTRRSRRNRFLAAAVVAIIAVALFAGVFGYWVGTMNSSNNTKLSNLQNQVTQLENQVGNLSSSGSSTLTEVVPENVSLSALYNDVKNSVVVITDTQSSDFVEGSGFIDDLSGRMVVVTNNHVIASGTGISVTFADGDAYSATVLGADPYADLAVLSVNNAPASEYQPLQVVNSTTLSVGDFVAAVGSPFGEAGSMTTGIVSALGRTVTETASGNYPIADVIQFSAPINPGNSGGPLLNSAGQVVGITTATLENNQNGGTAQGLGFAISSDTILREINSLVTTGSYTQYSYMGIGVVDNSYDIASQENLPVTYGLLVESVVSGGPAAAAGIKAGTNQVTIDGAQIVVGGDLITAINGVRMVNEDDLSTYMLENTLPGQTISVTIIRDGQTMNVSLFLGTRPASS